MNLMKYRNVYFAISLLVIIPCIVFLAAFGLRPAIDFTGGSLIEISVSDGVELSHENVQSALGEIYEVSTVQPVGENSYSIQGEALSEEERQQVEEKLSDEYGEVRLLRFESVGATVSQELLTKTAIAALLVAGMITLYVWRQFNELKFGVSAVLAMIHDSLVLLGVFSMLGYFYGVQVDILFVTALLTTLSFSIHDTIVVFDRIRELRRKNIKAPFTSIVNTAVVETLTRSINNSVTIIIMLTALSLLGGETIRWFSVALLVGAITGTYSSTFTAAPLLLLWEQVSARRKSK